MVSIFHHNGYQFNVTPYRIKSIRTTDGVINATLELETEVGVEVIPATFVVNGDKLTIMTIAGNNINVTGTPAQAGGTYA